MPGQMRRPAIAGLVVGFLGVAVLGLTATTAHAQPCTDELIMSQVRPWESGPNMGHVTLAGVPRSAERTIFQRTDAWRQMFVAAYPEGKGGSIKGNGVILDASVFTLPGVVPYKYEASFYPYWCNETRGNVLVTDPAYLTVNSAQVTANDLRYVLEEVSGGEYELDGHPVALFTLAHTKGTLAGLTVYESYGYDNSSAVILTHGGRLPYRALTQREYLEIVKAHWEEELAKEAGETDEQEREIKQQMEEIKKELAGEALAAALNGLNQQLAALAPMREERAAIRAQMREQEITPIDRYLATTPEPVLKQVAVPKSPGAHRGFTTEKEGGHKIVVLDATYLDKSLPPQAAQVIAMWWYNDPQYAGSRLFRQRIEQGFPFDKLKAMVDH